METEITTIREISISYKPSLLEDASINTSWEGNAIARRFFNEETISAQESFIIILLNKANKVLGVYPLSTGGLTGTVVDLRIIFAVILKALASNVILVHYAKHLVM